ncbi:hypothetical protein K432DRAFT_407142 [Lepidopterella palustris CBS 459.81]|uniref:Methyltransferase type 11 domain-containing protein n=1 Tax=Lepidopterella palustris CBS 459.81 TaxID=1314670 RepID=A0A8E2E5F4_9PEZI|nr:hypothetical protein K432DRAFT_407142 [Lepidopterella palustris CBS 459.81]
MASYKSQFNPPKKSDNQTPYSQRAPSTRLPQRSITPTFAQSQIPTPNPSKLQKKKYTRDDQAYPGRGVNNQRVATSNSIITDNTRRGGSKPSTPVPHGSSAMSIPRSILQPPSSRLPRFEVAANTRTPSLVSGSSVSTIDSPRSNLLRRRPSNIGVGGSRQVSRARAGSSSSQEEAQPMRSIPGGYKDPFSETVLGISLPPSSAILAHAEPELDPLDTRYLGFEDFNQSAMDNLPPPTPLYALSTTSSTRCSESPGNFSITSTPTSMSSHSPALATTTKTPSRLRQASPIQNKPPVTRRKTEEASKLREQHGLSSVRESSTSSSSASTIRTEIAKQKERTASSRLPAPPPSPSPRISSMYFTVSPSQGDISQSQASLEIHRSPPPPNHPPQMQTPPELAHLVDHPAKQSSRRPVRPSRDGTTEIVGLRGPSPIIQSNMTSFPSSHKRTSSSDSKMGVSAHIPNGKNRFGIPAKVPSRNPSPNPSPASGFQPVSRVPTRGPTPEAQSDSEKKRAKTLPTPLPSPSKTSRFGFFSRRTKTDPTVSTTKPDKKLQRKGPMAGTGHEGYGKYSVRGRSGSSTSGGSVGRSASAGTTNDSVNRTPSSRKSSITSTTSTEMDDFFLERLTPVVIRGTGSSELSRSPEPMRSVSSLDSVAERPKAEMRMGPSSLRQDSSSRTAIEIGRPTLLPSAMSDPVRTGSPLKKRTIGPRRPSESDDDAKRSFLPSLASRRISRRSGYVEGAALAKVPSPVNTAEMTSMKGLDSVVPGKSSVAESTKNKKAAPAPKPLRKWNFFQRAHAAPKVESPVVEVLAAAAKPPPSRSVAHYALMDVPNGIDLEGLEQIMQEADSSPEDQSANEVYQPSQPSQQRAAKEHVQSMLLPSPPAFPSEFAQPGRPASPKVTLRLEQYTERQSPLNNNVLLPAPPPPSQPSPQLDVHTDVKPPQIPSPPQAIAPLAFSPPAPPPSFPPPRPSRLPQVGRIPLVVSRRDRDRKPPSQSFSRPFAPEQPRPTLPNRTSVGSTNSLLATAGPVEPFPILQGLNALTHGSAIATISPSAEESLHTTEFFKFPPRKDSELSYSSSSGIWSFPPTTCTAVIPGPGAPQSEDEVWNEYDDLIDEVLSPIQPGKSTSATSTQGGSSMFIGLDANETKSQRQPPPEPLSLTSQPRRPHTKSNSGGSSTGPATTSLHLRRSRLLAVLHSAQTPTSPLSMSDFFAGYGDRNLSVVDPVTGRLSLPPTARMSNGSGPQDRPSSTRSSLPASLSLSARQSKATLASTSEKDRDSANPGEANGRNRYRDTRLIEMAETQNDGLVSMANLRFSALMTSKWLSFGRVLFSPAHFELKDPAEDRVLVIDGLGKDWSYYCALTYPEATIYNLGPGPSSTPASANTPSEPWSTLRNYRHIAHPSLDSPFPFPRGFFATAVFRFPAALPSSIHRTILSECKRVLRPGGYLEISVLDLDLVNMGNRARRAVRGLKVKMQVADEGVSLRNVSDEVMAGLGRRGFTGCNRCFVGVPVAGRLPPASDSDEDRNANGKGANKDGSASSASSASKSAKKEISFSDLLTTQSSNPESDDGITEMVARVGRWWYSRCYESFVLPEAGEAGAANSGDLLESSIWRDEALIRECEKRGTSFRLLIGYAQKPVVGVRRTVSV